MGRDGGSLLVRQCVGRADQRPCGGEGREGVVEASWVPAPMVCWCYGERDTPSLPQATRGRQQTTTTQGEEASGTGRRKGGVGEGLRTPGWWRWRWRVVCVGG